MCYVLWLNSLLPPRAVAVRLLIVKTRGTFLTTFSFAIEILDLVFAVSFLFSDILTTAGAELIRLDLLFLYIFSIPSA